MTSEDEGDVSPQPATPERRGNAPGHSTTVVEEEPTSPGPSPAQRTLMQSRKNLRHGPTGERLSETQRETIGKLVEEDEEVLKDVEQAGRGDNGSLEVLVDSAPSPTKKGIVRRATASTARMGRRAIASTARMFRRAIASTARMLWNCADKCSSGSKQEDEQEAAVKEWLDGIVGPSGVGMV